MIMSRTDYEIENAQPRNNFYYILDMNNGTIFDRRCIFVSDLVTKESPYMGHTLWVLIPNFDWFLDFMISQCL